MPFREIDHTADILIRVEAPTLEGLFSEAGRALCQVYAGSVEDRGVRRQISCKGDDLRSLLHKFLSELIFLADAESVVFASFDLTIDGTGLRCTGYGENLDPVRHAGGTEVKGVSFSGLDIRRTDGFFSVDLLLDV
ncbi:MAG: archease [Methanoculleaceae archaeon]